MIQELELNLAHLEDKQERDFERNKKMKEENQVKPQYAKGFSSKPFSS